jgi:hypothetical protein
MTEPSALAIAGIILGYVGLIRRKYNIEKQRR